MSPCSPQPKQCHVSRSGVTMNDGVFSAWKGQRPLETVPARLSETVSPTTSATGSFDLISATMPEELVIWRDPRAGSPRLSSGLSRGTRQFYHVVKCGSTRAHRREWDCHRRVRLPTGPTRPNHNLEGRCRHPANRARRSEGAPPELMRAAFRDLHGTRLHGFALLVTLGDRAHAARLTRGDALAAGMAQAAALRHPERAAAWLRPASPASRRTERRGRSAPPRPGGSPRAALSSGSMERCSRGLSGVDDPPAGRPRRRFASSGSTAVTSRPSCGVDGARLDRLIRLVRARYAAAVAERRSRMSPRSTVQPSRASGRSRRERSRESHPRAARPIRRLAHRAGVRR